MKNSLWLMVLLTVCCSPSSANNTPDSEKNPFSLGRAGNPENIAATTEPGLVLMGGSTDVDDAMRWMIDRAGGGDFVVIRASGGNGYTNYLYELGGLNSVETLLINSVEAANDPRVYEVIRSADALFIAGGDQSNYIRFWEGTKVQEAIQYLIHEKGAPIGGTSAGCAIMGEFVYTGEAGSVQSAEALSNPYHPFVTVVASGLVNHPMLPRVVTDQHFSQRTREGRLMVFMARISAESPSDQPVRGIAVDERTAAVIDKDGILRVLGQNRVYLLEESHPDRSPENLRAGQPLTWNHDGKAVRVLPLRQLDTTGNGIDILNWNVDIAEYWFVEEGVLESRNKN